MKIYDYRKRTINSGMGVAGRYKVQVVDYNGSIVEDRPWKNNLILDQGLDLVCAGTASLGSCFASCAVGTGTTPTYVDSGAVTVTIAAGTATASAGIFTAGMVGELLVTDDGTEQYITAFGTSTSVSVSGSNAAVAQLFTVWAVDQTGLATEVKRTNTYLTGSGNCGTTSNAGTATRTLKRTFDFSAEVSPQNYTELGWSYTNSAGNNLFSRVLIAGGTVSVLASQQLRVVYELSVLITPNTARAETAPISGWPVSPATNTDGDYIANAQGFSGTTGGLSFVDTNGNTSSGAGNQSLEPRGNGTLGLTSGSTLPTFNGSYTEGTITVASSGTLAAYTSGTFYRDVVAVWQASNGNRTDIRGIKVEDSGSTVAVFVFDQAQTKDNSHLLEITWRRNLSRIITNP